MPLDATPPPDLAIVDLLERPADIPTLAGWLKATFARNQPEKTVTVYAQRLRALPTPGAAFPRTWVAVTGGTMVGCARLTERDHPERPELSPWLASVFVTPAWRRRGIASVLVQTVQAAARSGGFPALYLFTPDQAPLYARQNFSIIGSVVYPDDGSRADLMVWRP